MIAARYVDSGYVRYAALRFAPMSPGVSHREELHIQKNVLVFTNIQHFSSLEQSVDSLHSVFEV